MSVFVCYFKFPIPWCRYPSTGHRLKGNQDCCVLMIYCGLNNITFKTLLKEHMFLGCVEVIYVIFVSFILYEPIVNVIVTYNYISKAKKLPYFMNGFLTPPALPGDPGLISICTQLTILIKEFENEKIISQFVKIMKYCWLRLAEHIKHGSLSLNVITLKSIHFIILWLQRSFSLNY